MLCVVLTRRTTHTCVRVQLSDEDAALVQRACEAYGLKFTSTPEKMGGVVGRVAAGGGAVDDPLPTAFLQSSAASSTEPRRLLARASGRDLVDPRAAPRKGMVATFDIVQRVTTGGVFVAKVEVAAPPASSASESTTTSGAQVREGASRATVCVLL